MILLPIIFEDMLKHNVFPYKIVPECSSLLKQMERLLLFKKVNHGDIW